MTTRSQKGEKKKDPVIEINSDDVAAKKILPSPAKSQQEKRPQYSPLSLRSKTTKAPTLKVGDPSLKTKCTAQEEEIDQLKKGKGLSGKRSCKIKFNNFPVLYRKEMKERMAAKPSVSDCLLIKNQLQL